MFKQELLPGPPFELHDIMHPVLHSLPLIPHPGFAEPFCGATIASSVSPISNTTICTCASDQ